MTIALIAPAGSRLDVLLVWSGYRARATRVSGFELIERTAVAVLAGVAVD
ncbi:hypothetical protein ACVWXN_000157 [Bradyrhizobium sp. i1.4.4]|nr:hypothetical protein [Bradyrhizobium japonicum]